MHRIVIGLWLVGVCVSYFMEWPSIVMIGCACAAGGAWSLSFTQRIFGEH